MNRRFVNLLLRLLGLSVGVAISTKLVPGITCDNGGTLAVVVILMSFFNAFVRPLLLAFTLPFIVLTLGLGIWFINAMLFYFTGRLVSGFHVAGFGSALWGALIVSVTSMVLNRVLAPPHPPAPPSPPAGRPMRSDDVIDI